MSVKADKGKVRFQSRDIGDKPRQDKLFVNVKGEGKRKRQQRKTERKVLREARREARKQRKPAHKVASAKRANKTAQRRDRWQVRKVAFVGLCRKIAQKLAAFAKFAFTGKRKFISSAIIVVLVALLANMIVYRCAIVPAREARADEQYAQYVEKDAPIMEGVSSYVSYLMANDATSDEVTKYLNGVIERYDENSDLHFVLSVYYANFVGRNKDNSQGISRLDSLRDQAGDVIFRQEYLYNAYYELYSINQDYQKGNEYAKKVNDMHRRIVKNRLESSEEYYKKWSNQ